MAVAWSHRPIPSGTHDILDRLLIPEKLYGREVNALLGAFDRVVAHGAPELVLVSGYSGGGKSSVVNELHKVLVLSITMRPDRPRAWENWTFCFSLPAQPLRPLSPGFSGSFSFGRSRRGVCGSGGPASSGDGGGGGGVS